MKDIPADVMKAADAAICDGPEFMLPDYGVDREALTLAIAHAIMAERERCAEIVIEWQKQLVIGERIEWHVDRIVSTIRGNP